MQWHKWGSLNLEEKLTDYNYIFITNKVQIDSPENISYDFKHCLFHKKRDLLSKGKPDIYTAFPFDLFKYIK